MQSKFGHQCISAPSKSGNMKQMNWGPFVCLSSGMKTILRKSRSFVTEKIPKIAKDEWNPRFRGRFKL
jgi:hypothetical protein